MTDILKTRVMIAGAGAIGGYIAARLIEKGVATTVMTRPERFEQIVVHGLRLTSQYGRFWKPVRGVVSPQIDEPYDLVVIACRSHLLRDALDQAASAIGPSTFVLSLTDGGPNIEFLRRRCAPEKVMEGIAEGRILIDADGVIRHRAPEMRICVGERHPGHHVAKRIAELLNGRGLIAKPASDMLHLSWARSIFLAAGVAVPALTGRPLMDALRYRPGSSAFDYGLAEGRAIAAANGVQIDKLTTRRYRDALFQAGAPIMPPPRLSDSGGAGDEAFYLLTHMIRRRGGQGARTLRQALDASAEARMKNVIDA